MRPTSGVSNRARAKGERAAASRDGKSATAPSPITSRPGRNFKVAGLGVDSVWMNMIFCFLEPFQSISYMDPASRRIKAAKSPQ